MTIPLQAIINVLKLVRFGNLLILLFTQYFIKIFLITPNSSLSDQLQDVNLFLLVLSTILVAAAGYIINDYYDVKIDAINKPNRILIDRHLKRRVIIILHISFNLIAFGIAACLSTNILILDVSAAFLLWIYSNQLKRLPLIGNLTVASLSALSILTFFLYYEKGQDVLFHFAYLAFAISMIREIIKDIEDMKGDQQFDCKTLPILLGPRRTKFFIYIFATLLVGLSFYFLYNRNPYMNLYLIFFILLPILWLLFFTFKADKLKDYRSLSNHSKLMMVMGLGSMIFYYG